jgi:Fe2+ or Zn2+ uptake regulation protein
MLELERAIDEFDNFSTNLCSDLRESWQRIKAFYEAQNTAHNSAMVLCDDCGDVAEYHLCKKCMRKDAAFYAQHH